MQLTVTQNIIALNLTVTYLGTTVELQPTIVAGGGSSITNTSQLVNDGENGVNPFLTSETDPVFQAWLATNPLNGFLTSETDPVFQAWLATNPLNGFLTEETDPVFQAWLATNPLNGFLTSETDPVFQAWLATNPLSNKADLVSGVIPVAQIPNFLLELDVYKNWHSIVSRKESAGLLYTNANSGNYVATGSVSLVNASGVSRRATFWATKWLSAATAGALCGIRQQNSSETALRSGYEAYFIFVNDDTNQNGQTIIGFTSLLADFPNVDFSAYTGDFQGIGNEVGDANLSIIVKTAANAPQSVVASYTKIPLGPNFPAHNTTDVYLAKLEAPQTEVRANQYIKISILNLINGASDSHTFNSSLCPALSANICFKFQKSARNSGLPTSIALLKYLFKSNHY